MITERFSNDKSRIECKTVGDVIRELSRIPAETPVKQGFGETVEVILFNASYDDSHVSFDDSGDWEDEEEEEEPQPKT